MICKTGGLCDAPTWIVNMANVTTVKVETEGIDRLLRDVPSKGDILVEKAAKSIEARARVSMVGGGTPHVPSLPGEPPHREFGALAEGIHVHPKEKELEREVGDSVEYGIYLEFGTERGVGIPRGSGTVQVPKMAARPWLIPAMVKEIKPFMAAWRMLIERG